MLLLVAYYRLDRYGKRHGRERYHEHVPNVLDKPLCGAQMDSEKLVWKIIDSKPVSLCHRCQELTKKPTDEEKLNAWNEWAVRA